MTRKAFNQTGRIRRPTAYVAALCVMVMSYQNTFAAADAKTAPEEISNTAAQLRCWQNGVMILSENNLSAPQLQKHEEALAFGRTNKHREKLQVFEIGNAVCAYQERD